MSAVSVELSRAHSLRAASSSALFRQTILSADLWAMLCSQHNPADAVAAVNFRICYLYILNACLSVLKNIFRSHFIGSVRITGSIARNYNAAEESRTVNTRININSADRVSVTVKGSAERTCLRTDRRPLVSNRAGSIELDIRRQLTLY